MTAKDCNNLRFFVLFWLTSVLTKNPIPTPQGVSDINVRMIDDGEIEMAIDEVWSLYEGLGKTDQVAKGSELRKATVESVQLWLEASDGADEE